MATKRNPVGGGRKGVPFLPTQVTQILWDLQKEGLVKRSTQRPKRQR